MDDVAIIGGGLVGLCAALALQHPARRIGIIEAGNLRQAQAGGLNARSIALSISSVQVFRALGIWPEIKALSTPIRHIHISARGRWGVTRLHADDYDLDALGYVIESHALGECLLRAVDACADIELHEEAVFETLADGDSVRVDFRSKAGRDKLEARLALIADGANSQARAQLGIDHRIVDYGQAVVISNVEVSQPASDTAYERFTPRGPLAMLPLGARRYACVWTRDPQQAERVSGLGDDDFCAALQDCFGYRLGLVERAGERFSMPLKRTRAERLYQGRCLLIGNAANALHPVAGQSFNLSLRDIACCYEMLVDQRLEALDGAQLRALTAEYARQRLAEQGRVIRYGDGLVSLFSNELPLFDQARAAGLGILDLLPALKTQVALAGMGMAFGGNRMLRGHL